MSRIILVGQKIIAITLYYPRRACTARVTVVDVQEIVDVQGEKRKIVSILKEDTGNNHPLRQKDLLREIFQLVSL